MKLPDDQLALRKCWGRFATGVSVITTTLANRKIHGMTASGILSVTLDPPVVLVSIGVDRNTHSFVKNNQSFGISFLNSNQKNIAEYFSKDNPCDNTDDFEYEEMPGGQFVITEAIGQLECKLFKEIKIYDHTLFLAKIENFNITSESPLIWLDSKYHSFQ